MPALIEFTNTVAGPFCLGQSYYGDIDVSLDLFSEYVWSVACKHLEDSPNEAAAIEFTKKLYLRDLYLACGCVYKNDRAWATFDRHYRGFITNLVRLHYRRGTDSEEIADSVLVSLYFHDRSGRQRIASYDGRSSLPTWLRAIVVNRAINDRNERTVASGEGVADVPDCQALANLESAMLADRYGRVLSESLAHALREITPEERLLLLWRYEQNLRLGEIAQLMGLHQSNVTRQLLRLQCRLRQSIVATLGTEYHLSSAAIQECLADVVTNPQSTISLLNLIKEIPKPRMNSVDASLPGGCSAELRKVAWER